MLTYIIYIIIGGVLVLVGADKLTDGAVGLATRFGISELVIGLTIVAFGTSLPEFIVSLLANLSADSSATALSVSNIVGSNLFNTLVIAGASAAISPILIQKSSVKRDIPLCLLASVVLSILALDHDVWRVFNGQWSMSNGQWSMFNDQRLEGTSGVLTRVDGLVLLSLFAVFMAYSFNMAKHRDEQSAQERMPTAVIVLSIVLGLGALIGGGELFVDGACGLARLAGVSETVIGLTIVAGGTSLPELATSVVAARKGQSGLAIGNVVGSNIFNILFILGVCATAKPLAVTGLGIVDFTVLTASVLLFWLFTRSAYRLSRLEGCTMMLAYLLYLAWRLSDYLSIFRNFS